MPWDDRTSHRYRDRHHWHQARMGLDTRPCALIQDTTTKHDSSRMFPSSARGRDRESLEAETLAFIPQPQHLAVTTLFFDCKQVLSSMSYVLTTSTPELFFSHVQAAFTVAIMSEISSAPGHSARRGVANNRPCAANPVLPSAHQSSHGSPRRFAASHFCKHTLLPPISADSR